MMTTYEDNLHAVLKKQGVFVEFYQAEVVWGMANGAPVEFIDLYRELATSSLALIEDLLDTHFEALGDDPPKALAHPSPQA